MTDTDRRSIDATDRLPPPRSASSKTFAAAVGTSQSADTRAKRRLWNAVYDALLLTAAAANLLVMGLRLESVLRLGGRVQTTGMEGPGSLGVYEVCAHGTLYHDYSRIPNNFVFNYIYYQVYGWTDRLFAPCTVSTPLVSRLLTFLLAIALAAILFRSRGPRLRVSEALAIAAAALSPYIGWWAFAIRPDVGGAVLFALALVAMLAYLRGPSLAPLLAACLLVYGAWGCKQTYVFAVPLMALYVFRRNRGHAVLFLLLFVAGVALPFLLYGPRVYFWHTILAESRNGFDLSVIEINLTAFFLKTAPAIVLTIPIVIGTRRLPRNPGRAFLIAMLAFSFAVFAVAAAKDGAGDNYWFPTFVTALLLVSLFAADCTAPLRNGAFLAFGTLTVLAGAALLAGARGTLTLVTPVVGNEFKAAKVINGLPGPKMVWGSGIAPPWMTKDVEARITYPAESLVLVPGGYNVVARMKREHYATIAIEGYQPDWLDLSGYRKQEEIGGTAIFTRKP
jgi:MFS family permease